MKKRTLTQNKALHLYFTIISDELNNLGLEFCFTGLKNIDISIPYTPTIFKECFWKPVQIAMFDKKSTTEINTKEINQMINVFNKFFGERGIVLDFPSIETLMNKGL